MKIIFKRIISSLVNNHIIFFYIFIFFSFFSIRKILFLNPVHNQFNEYSAIYLYLSDIFLFLTILLWIISILQNKYYKLSSINPPSNVPRGTFINFKILRFFYILANGCKIKYILNILKNPLILLPLLLIIWSFISINWSQDKLVALFRSIKLFEFYVLFLYIKCTNVPPARNAAHIAAGGRETLFINIAKIIIVLGLLNSSIGIIQFINQESVGLTFLKESIISPEIPGVAKIEFLNNFKIIRSYGLFPHPNIFGGFLIFSIILSLMMKKLFHLPEMLHISQQAGLPEMLHISQQAGVKHYEEYFVKQNYKSLIFNKKLINIFIIIQLLALLLTFSKSALIGLFISLIYLYKKDLFELPNRVKQLLEIKNILLIIFVITAILFISNINLNSLFVKSLQERIFYINVSRGTISDNFITGVGSGQFISNLSNNLSIENWQLQPVHNVYLLIFSELGIIGLTFFLLFITYLLFQKKQSAHKKLFHVEQFNKYSIMHLEQLNQLTILIYIKSILLAFLFIMLFDHYMWDIQQGQTLLWIIAGIITSLASIDN